MIDAEPVAAFDLSGLLRRIRRTADLSQRELAERIGVSKSAIGAAEAGRAGLDACALARAAGLAGLRVALLDEWGDEVTGMAEKAVRDAAHRRYPAHLDVRHGDQGWWADFDRYTLQRPWYTFDRVRWSRDWLRRRWGTPEDHILATPENTPTARRARRAQESRRREAEERRRRIAAGEIQEPIEWVCTCPPRCDELDDRSGKPVHADDCSCGCDVA